VISSFKLNIKKGVQLGLLFYGKKVAILFLGAFFFQYTFASFDEQYFEEILGKAQFYERANDFKLAVSWYEKTLDYAQEYLGESNLETIELMEVVGTAYLSTPGSVSDSGIELLKKAIVLRQEALTVNDIPSLIESTIRLSNILSIDSQESLAESLLIRGLQICRDGKRTQEPYFWHLLESLGRLKQSQGDYASSKKFYMEAINLISSEDSEFRRKPLGDIKTSLATLYYEQGLYADSEKQLNQVLVMFKAAKESPYYMSDIVDVKRLLADLYRAQGRVLKSEEFYKESLAYYKDVGEEESGNWVNNAVLLANLYLDLKRYSDADKLFRGAIDVSLNITQGEFTTSVLSIKNNLAKSLTLQYRYSEAEREMLDVRDKTISKYWGEKDKILYVLNQLAIFYRVAGELNKSERVYIEVLRISREIYSASDIRHLDIVLNYGFLRQKQKKYNQAEQIFKKDIQARIDLYGVKTEQVLESKIYLGRLYYESGAFDKAEEISDQILPLMNYLLTYNLWGANKPTRRSYIQSQRAGLDFYYTLFSSNDTDESARRALSLSLNRKGSLLDIETQIHILTHDDNGVSRTLAKSLMNNEVALSSLLARGEGASVKAARLVSEIEAQQSKLGSMAYKYGRTVQVITPADVIENLNLDEAFIDYIVYRPYSLSEKELFKSHYGLLAIVTTKSEEEPVKLVNLGEMSSIDSLINTFLKRMKAPAKGNFNNVSVKLYERIWRPLESHLLGIKKVYIAPDGGLSIFPFAALKKTKESPFLVQSLQISNVTSGRDIVFKPVEFMAGPPAIFSPGLYSPDQKSEYDSVGSTRRESTTLVKKSAGLKFNALPDALMESRYIKRLLEKDKDYRTVHYYPLEKSTEEAVLKLESPKILHFATHGFYRESKTVAPPEARVDEYYNAGLAFTNANLAVKGEEEYGVLTPEEILTLDLKGTQLVVMSACETGLGEVNINEGVSGLKQSFQNAGAKAVMSTLWNIDSRSSASFMGAFYKNYLNDKKASAQDALYKTQNEFIVSDVCYKYGGCLKHPMHWAAFTVVGKD